MIFIIKDDHNVKRDTVLDYASLITLQSLARHVLSVHMNARTEDKTEPSSELELSLMKKYIQYCRSKSAPRLSPEAAIKLSNHYVSMRSDVHKFEKNTGERSTIPITVRQLEAIVRISEALAKISLSPVANEQHVDEALNLFKVSTMQAALSGHNRTTAVGQQPFLVEGMARMDIMAEVDRVEKTIKNRIAVGSSCSMQGLLHELVDGKGFKEHNVRRAIDMMVQQEKLLVRNQRKVLVRQK